MNKKVDVSRLKTLIAECRRATVVSQCCFVIGYPGESEQDLAETRSLFRELVKKGADDISFFIMAPVPGSQSEGSLGEVGAYEGFKWSPRWRKDYQALNWFRTARYLEFFILKSLYHPASMAGYLRGIFSGRYREQGRNGHRMAGPQPVSSLGPFPA